VLPVIYEAGQDADWQDEELWRRVNPNLGVSLSLDFLRAECRRAKENPAYENTFRRLYLNQVVKQDVRIVPMEAFDACAGPIELAEFVGRRCYGGLDLASTKDLASFCLAFPGESEAEPVTVVVWAWCPQARVTQRDERGVPYQAWAREGHLFATSGNEIDYGVIEQHIKACANKYDVREIGFDGWNAAQITQNLMAAGLAMVKVPASLDQLSAPTKELLRRIRAGTLRHNGNPVLRWAASNVAAYYRGVVRYAADVDELLDKVPIMFSKQKSADKIDPMAAIVLAFNRMIAHPDEQAGESVYESRGMAFV
jgi:phage terminase large subunit-like protein